MPTGDRARDPRRAAYGRLLRFWGALSPPEWLEGLICWAINPRYLIGVTGLIWDDAGRLLLVRQTYAPRPWWSLPGGWLGPGERLEACARRELREELALEVEVGPMAGWAELWPPRHYAFAFDCRVLSGSVQLNAEIAEVAYWTPGEALRRIRPRARPLLQDVFRRRAPGSSHEWRPR